MEHVTTVQLTTVLNTVQLSGVNIVVSVGYILFAVIIWRRYDEIGSRTLSLFAGIWGINFVLASLEVFIVASYGVTTGAELSSLSVPANVELLLFVIAPLTELFTVTAIYTWLWFVLNYTTRLARQEKVAIAGVSVLLIFITALNALVGVVTTFGYVEFATDTANSFHRFAGIVEILGTGVAISAGIAQLFRAAQRHPLFKFGAVPALSASILLLYLIRYIYRLGFIPAFQTIELLRFSGHVIGLGGLWLAVTRYRLFRQLPASQTVGRDTALDNIETAIVLLNRRFDVADINPAGESLFNVSATNVIGQPVETILPDSADEETIQEGGGTTFEFPNSDRIVQAETAQTVDDSDREIGRTTVFKDITEERRRQQRIQVLNRVLRHNLRNNISVATGYLEAIAEGAVDPDEYAPQAQETLEELITLGNKAREIEDILSVDATVDTANSLAKIVTDAVGEVEEAHTVGSIRVEIPSRVGVQANPRILRSVLTQLIENAVEHTDEENIAVTFDEQTCQLAVSDTGSGIPDYEIAVFEAGEETDLEHGSGLGLWLVKWGVDRIGAGIRFDTEGDGTRAIIVLPDEQVTSLAEKGASGTTD